MRCCGRRSDCWCALAVSLALEDELVPVDAAALVDGRRRLFYGGQHCPERIHALLLTGRFAFVFCFADGSAFVAGTVLERAGINRRNEIGGAG